MSDSATGKYFCVRKVPRVPEEMSDKLSPNARAVWAACRRSSPKDGRMWYLHTTPIAPVRGFGNRDLFVGAYLECLSDDYSVASTVIAVGNMSHEEGCFTGLVPMPKHGYTDPYNFSGDLPLIGDGRNPESDAEIDAFVRGESSPGAIHIVEKIVTRLVAEMRVLVDAALELGYPVQIHVEHNCAWTYVFLEAMAVAETKCALFVHFDRDFKGGRSSLDCDDYRFALIPAEPLIAPIDPAIFIDNEKMKVFDKAQEYVLKCRYEAERLRTVPFPLFRHIGYPDDDPAHAACYPEAAYWALISRLDGGAYPSDEFEKLSTCDE